MFPVPKISSSNILHCQCKKCILGRVNTAAAHTSDGRTRRGARTRDSVVEAFLTLTDEGNLRPTARQISERAGVSLRSVFQHFDDLETLFAAAADRQVERVAHLSPRIDPALPFEERLERFAAARAELYEAVTPVRRSALLGEPFSPELARRLKWSRDRNREEIERVFAPELRGLAVDEGRIVVAALHSATEWAAWETLRAHDGLSKEDARCVMLITVRALLRKER